MKTSFKPGTMLNPVPVVMISSGNEKKSNIFTVAWAGIINSEPPMLEIAVRPSRYSYELIKESGEFAVNLVNEKLLKACDYCGVVSGRDVDKWAETGLTPVPAETIACPLIEESPVNLECKVKEVREYGSHHMFAAEITRVHVDEKLIDLKGKIWLEHANLIAYNHGFYQKLYATPVGSFGYSVMKEKTKKKRAADAKNNKKNRG